MEAIKDQVEMCEFYEVDKEAKAECEAMDASYIQSLGGQEAYEAELKAAEEMAKAMGYSEEDDPFAKCGPYCKYLKWGKGYPGESVAYCSCSGHEHIIDTQFDESEVI